MTSVRAIAGATSVPTLILAAFAAFMIATGAAQADTAAGRLPQESSARDLPRSKLGSYLSAYIARGEGDISAAARHYATALSLDPENESLRERALFLLMSDGRFSDALGIAEQVIAQNADHPYANLMIAVDRMRGGEFEAVLRQIDSANINTFNQVSRALLQAWSLLGAGRGGEAALALETLSGRSSIDFVRDFHQGLVATLARDDETATAAFDDALKADYALKSRAVLAAAGHAYGDGSDPAGVVKARTLLEDHLASVRRDEEATAALAELTSGAGLQPLIRTPADGLAEGLFAIGASLTGNRNLEFAALYLNLSRYLRPNLPIAQTVLAEAMESAGHYERAIALYEGIDPASPLRRNAMLRKAYALDGLDRTDEAVALLRELSAARPQDADQIVALGNILRARERFAEAASEYRRAIEVYGAEDTPWTVYYSLGISLERDRRWQEAEPHFLKALELEPDQPLVLNYLGYTWIEKGLHLDRAMGMVELAVEQRPRDGYIVDSLGWAHFQLGNFEEAVTHLERAIDLTPQDPTINDHLGDAYWKVGRKREARFQWGHAMTFEPEARFEDRIARKLEVGLDAVEAEEAAALAKNSAADSATDAE